MMNITIWLTEALTIFIVWSWDMLKLLESIRFALEQDDDDDPDGGIPATSGAVPAPLTIF